MDAPIASGKDRRMSRLLLPLLMLVALTGFLQAEPLAEAEGDQLFRDGHYREAAAWYAGVAAADHKVLSDKQREAWAFSRIKVAANLLIQPGADSAACEKEVAAAMALVPNRADVQKLGQSVLTLAHRASNAVPAEVPSESDVIETASFTVRFQGSRELAEKVAESAESKRTATFELWSGPPGAAWTPKCEIVIHDSAEAYRRATNQAAERTGLAQVKLAEGKALERRIDLRADDDAILTNAVPRELTHIVVADLFPFSPPPKWAEEGMAVLAGSPEEASRYLRTTASCARDGKLFTVAALLDMKDFPAADKITGYCCGSVSLTEYLVKLKGEKHFTTFLRDCQRYGSTSAIRRQYGFDSPKTLQDAWLKAVLK
jgi:hypothetical protein